MPQRPYACSTGGALRSFNAGMDILYLGLAPLSLMAAAVAYAGLIIVAMRR